MTDYYRLLKLLKLKNGKYVLQIREYENEFSYLDNFKLIAVDHLANTKIDVATDGSILQYKTPGRLRRARFKGDDITQKLLAFDSLKVSVRTGDTLSLDLSDSTYSSKGMRATMTAEGGEGGGDGLPKVDKIAAIVAPRSVSSSPATFTFRQRSTLVFTPMSVSSRSDWKITWDANARLDYFNYGVMVQTPYTTRELALVSAVHSAMRNVRGELSEKDNIYTTLQPGQLIELQFAGLEEPPAGKKRTFILVSQGRYETLSDSVGTKPPPEQEVNETVTEFRLNANFPNPFNPVTTISFQTPVEGHAVVLIYNMLGQEVARLFDRDVNEGSYSVQWNAGNASSGIYFCHYLITGTREKELYSEVKKVLLMR